VVWSADGEARESEQGVGRRTPAWEQKPPHYLIGSVAVSADGKRVLFSDQEAGVGVLDLPARELLGRCKLPDVYYQDGAARYDVRDVLAVSPDGKTVAWSGVESTADVYLIEVRTRTVRRKLPGDSYPVKRLTFSPDGSKLLSAGPDGAALVWDLFGRSAEPVAAPDATTVTGWWDALDHKDAAVAVKAMRVMTASPAEAVKLLAEKLPAEKVEPLRAERAVEVLERIGTAEATKVLETLAAGKDKPLAADATAALARRKATAR
jgi:dipeptidyl aminopeptidase/acylaminoacyl peptidase